MKTALISFALAAAVTTTPAACQKNTTTSTTTTKSAPATAKVDTTPQDREWECDMKNHAINVKPNTAANRAYAEQSCQKMGKAIDEAPWPGGMTPIPLPNH